MCVRPWVCELKVLRERKRMGAGEYTGRMKGRNKIKTLEELGQDGPTHGIIKRGLWI